MKKLLLAAIIFIIAYTISYAQCIKPADVQIISSNNGVITICEGTTRSLAGIAMVPTSSIQGGFRYSWVKTTPTSSTLVQPTIIFTTPGQTIISIPAITLSGALTDAGTYVLHVEDGLSGNPVCFTVATVVVNVTPAVTTGVISAAQTICSGGDPAAFTQTTAASGGTGAYTYQWEKSFNGGAYADIAGATAATFDEGILINSTTTVMTVDYRRKVTSGSGACPQVTSAPVRITVNPTIVAGVIAASQTICSGGDPAAFTQTVAASGGTGTYTYVWQCSATSVTAGFATIASATNTTYDPPAGLTATTYYRRVDASGTCMTANTNVITVTVTPSVTPSVTITTPSTTICAGTSVTFTASPSNGGTTPTYVWRKNAIIISGISGATYTTTDAMNGDSYDVVMTSNASCASPLTATSNAVVMTVTSVVTPAVSITATPGNTICAGTSVTFTASPGNGGTTPIYQWFINGTSQGAASTTATLTKTTLSNGDAVSVQMTSNSGCVAAPGIATSNVITMVVNPIVTPTVTITANRNTICTNGQVTFTATPTYGGTAPTYQWTMNGTYLSQPSSSRTFTTTALMYSTDVVGVILTSNALCASPTTAYESMSINVNNGIGAGTIGSNQTICYNTIPAAITQLSAPINIVGTATYTWEFSLDGTSAWTTNPGASGIIFTPTIPLTADVFIRRITIDPGTPAPCNVAYSNTVHIVVTPQLVAGVIAANETICAGTAASTITPATAPTGGTGTYTYQWVSSTTSGGPYSNIASATGATYSPGVLTTTRYFRRQETSGICGSVHSNEVAKIVTPLTVSTIHIDDPGQTCDGDIVLFKCQATTVGTNPVYNWYVNNDIVLSTSPPLINTSTIHPFENGDEVWVELVSNNICADASPVISNKVIVDLVPCTVSSSIYTTTNIDILLQPYVSNSDPNATSYTYYWAITDGSTTTATNLSLAQAGINLFPNPATESFYIDMPESGVLVQYDIVDATGLSVAKGTFTSTGTSEQIKTNFGAGMYQVILTYNNSVTSARLSKVQ